MKSSSLNKAQIAEIQQKNNELFAPLMGKKSFFTAEDLKNTKIYLAGAEIRELTQKLLRGG